jgi:hypothetical protein
VGQSVDDLSYYDSTKGLTFKFDPFTLQGEVVSDVPVEQPTSELREGISEAMGTYVETCFRKDKALY